MKIIKIHATPHKTSEHFKKCGGAYVNCWINYAHTAGAFYLAEKYLTSENWVIVKTDKKFKEISSTKGLTKEEKQYFKEASKYGYSLIFHMYPVKEKKKK